MRIPRLQFSLRSLLIFALICAVVCATLGRKIARKREERAVAERFATVGGQVDYDSDTKDSRPEGPEWLRRILGDNFFNEIVEVFLSQSKVTDGDLKALRHLPQLQRLYATETAIGDAGLENLSGLVELRELALDKTQVTDAGLANLRGLTRLESLRETAVTDAGVNDLQKCLPNCKINR